MAASSRVAGAAVLSAVRAVGRLRPVGPSDDAAAAGAEGLLVAASSSPGGAATPHEETTRRIATQPAAVSGRWRWCDRTRGWVIGEQGPPGGRTGAFLTRAAPSCDGGAAPQCDAKPQRGRNRTLYGSSMTEVNRSQVSDSSAIRAPSPLEQVRPLLRARQVRQFTPEPVSEAELHALTEVARWCGSSRNQQPWRFIVIRDARTLRRLHQAGQPQTRSLETAAAAIAITLPNEKGRAVADAYDDGRASERIMIAASILDLGAGIAWVRSDVRDAVREILELPEDRMVRTIVSLGHPTAEARRPRSKPGEARLPREQVVFEERWPKD